MARKKFLDENNEENLSKSQQRKEGQGGKSFQSHHNQLVGYGGHFLGVGGGTKNHPNSTDYHHPNSKNADESYGAVGKQLSSIGLTIREMPGDGNCLFRALSDQITGSSRNHLEYRRAVVQYMKEFRSDFEPFVEDDVPFDKYVQRLSQAGTFAGNDAIVSFARLHNVSVVIHQLNSPAWVIHPTKDTQEPQGGREVHIFYHNGDHYNSVRRIGDDSENPTNIKLHTQESNSQPGFKNTGKKSPPHTASCNSSTSADCYSSQFECKRDEDYWVKDTGDVDRLVEEVMQQTNYPDPSLVRETLLDYNFDMVATIDFIISMSVMMNQHQCQELVREPVLLKADKDDKNYLAENSNDSGIEPIPSMDKDCTNITVFPANELAMDEKEKCTETITKEPSVPESDEGSSSPNECISSQDSYEPEGKTTSRKEPKLSSRQKKDLKRRERKREADIRRKVVDTNNSANEKENIVVVSNLGSLDI